MNIDYSKDLLYVGNRILKLHRVVPTIEDILDVCVAKRATPDSVDGKEWDNNFHNLKPAGEFMRKFSNVEFEKFQRGNLDLATGEEGRLEWCMQRGMLDEKPDGTGYYEIEDWTRESSSINETVKESIKIRNRLRQKVLKSFNEGQEAQRQIKDKRIPKSDKTLALNSNIFIKKDGILRTVECSCAVARYKPSSNELFDCKNKKRRKNRFINHIYLFGKINQ